MIKIQVWILFVVLRFPPPPLNGERVVLRSTSSFQKYKTFSPDASYSMDTFHTYFQGAFGATDLVHILRSVISF